MDSRYNVCLSEIVEALKLKVLTCEEKIASIFVDTPDLNRPGLELAGYFGEFTHDRIQIVGNAEMNYLKEKDLDVRSGKIEKLFSMGFPCFIIARSIEPFTEIIESSKKYGIPVLTTDIATTELYSELNKYLCVQLAPRISMHAGLIEIYGEGVLIMGSSGVGKSETALELIKRGHRLIADDLVEVRRVSGTTLVGSSPEIIRHLIEIRGVGFVDVRHLYGVGSVKVTENIQLVIKLERWVEGNTYERVGDKEQYENILGIDVPCVTIPVIAGRNLAVIIEAATMNNREKQMGYNAAAELEKRVFGRG